MTPTRSPNRTLTRTLEPRARSGVDVRQGDCMEILPTLRDGSAAVFVADPPYATPAQTTQRTQWNKAKPNVADLSIMEGFFRAFFNEADRILNNDGVAFIFCDEESAASVRRASYHHFRSKLIVWDKQRLGMGQNYRHTFELIYFLRKWDGGGLQDPDKGRPDIIQGPIVPPVARQHPSEKPVWLVEELLRDAPTGLVIDPFAGSGTTGVAAQRLGRDALLIELNHEYADAIQKRIDAAAAQSRLTEP